MSPAPRPFALLLALALLAITAGSVRADDNIVQVPLEQWVDFGFGSAGTSTPTYATTVPLDEAGYLLVTDAYCSGDRFTVNINGQDKGLTSEPTSVRCDLSVGYDPDSALTVSDFSHRAYPLAPGTSAFMITATASPYGGGAGFFKVGKGVYVDPTLGSKFKVVTGAGKVNSKDAAIAACQAAGLTLADVTQANWADVVNAVRASTAVNPNPLDAVVVNSWDGNDYGGVALQLNVRATSDTITNAGITLLNAPAYPLCQQAATLKAAAATNSSTTAAVAAPPTPQIARKDGNLAVIGPATHIKHAAAMCKQALGDGATPAVLDASKPAEVMKATALAVSVVGVNKQVWVGGNRPSVLVTKAVAPGQAVTSPDNAGSDKYILCKKT
ncbi:hypothetical protein AMAG_03238 [Allomyces macrogynus ATCC 38327]|uniref:Uncharacterized protein n=1 Tax=Allomyces macrogynus (strain ATCC 38327) TaxID=578462 RepID=A0A0L0S4T8_ALLM3|nr:hypothetical protein AMAG_03238 [Allomyces macrogynus ATCC 38327]|eukprot:KNE57538.1 hypothetical protein AMAG_03238 [Allomyces macrogynus ATCC 38327]